ncbi:MAG: hypothetical protein OEV66_10615, partial [Spirochaetia bacterium]|nr:hypothetical protein [Spirochaetia bacterium]
MRCKPFLFILLVFLFSENMFSATLHPEERNKGILKLAKDFKYRSLGDILLVCPPSVNPPLNKLQCKYFSRESIARQVQYYALPVWMYLAISNTTSVEQAVVLEHNLAITRRITLLDTTDSNARVKESGDGISIKNRDYVAALPAFRIVFKPYETKMLRISLESDIDTMLDFKLYSEKEYLARKQKTEIIQAAFYGLMSGMILFNFLLFLRLRLQIYFLYVCFIAFLTFIYLGLYGHGFAFLWPDAFIFQKYSHSIFKFFVSFIGISFFNNLLSVQKRIPRLFQFARFISFSIIPLPLLLPFVSPRTFFALSNISGGVAIAYMFVISLLSVLRKLPFSIFYILAMMSFISGVIANLLMVGGVIPANNVTYHAMQVGTALEAIFISIILGDRFAGIEKENHKLQVQRIEDKKQIAQDIHDVLGTELSMQLLEIETGKKNELSIKLAAGLRKTVQKVREYLFLLHTDENLSVTLLPNIQELLRRLEFNANLQVKKDFEISNFSLGSIEAYHLERAIEESISNLA